MAGAFVKHVAKRQLKKMAKLSSKMGSTDFNISGESYIYYSSKAAVNMVVKNLSIDLKPYGISFVKLHPGWMQTDTGAPNVLISTHTSVTGMRSMIENLSLKKHVNLQRLMTKPWLGKQALNAET